VSKIVLDASALLAILGSEPGSEKLTPKLLGDAVSSTVNLTEVQAKLVSRGIPPEDAWEATLSPIREPEEFTAAQAKIAGNLIAHTNQLGLSLGDRACLALGLVLGAPIYTADHAWKSLKLGVRIHVIR
jgi:PIN domain nuclease of toxin-antitoxin system